MTGQNAAEKAAAEKAKKRLVAVTKDGAVLRVCKAQVKHHEAMGWKVVKK